MIAAFRVSRDGLTEASTQLLRTRSIHAPPPARSTHHPLMPGSSSDWEDTPTIRRKKTVARQDGLSDYGQLSRAIGNVQITYPYMNNKVNRELPHLTFSNPCIYRISPFYLSFQVPRSNRDTRWMEYARTYRPRVHCRFAPKMIIILITDREKERRETGNEKRESAATKSTLFSFCLFIQYTRHIAFIFRIKNKTESALLGIIAECSVCLRAHS